MDSPQTDDSDNGAIGPCQNAEEYAIEYLKSADGTAKPSEIAAEYGCTPGHMQDALRDSDEIDRVEIGHYALSTETTTTDEDTESGVESEDVAPLKAPDPSEDVDAVSERPSVDGPARLEDTDTTAGDRVDSKMPTEKEYQQFKATSGAEGNETGADDGEDIDESDGDGSESVAAEDVEEIDVPTEQGGVPIVAVVAGAIALFAVYWFVFRDSGQGSQPAQSTQQSSSRDDEDEDVSLIE
jgi:hypothetical protein